MKEGKDGMEGTWTGRRRMKRGRRRRRTGLDRYCIVYKVGVVGAVLGATGINLTGIGWG